MKRILAILLSVSLLFVCIPAFPISAEDFIGIPVIPDSAEGTEGVDYETYFGVKYTYGKPFATMDIVYSQDWEHPDWLGGTQNGGSEVSTRALRDGEWDAYYYFTDSFHNNYYDNDHVQAFNIRLDRDVTTEFFPQNLHADINIDLNGHTWTVTDMQSTRGCFYNNITISGGTLTVKNHVSCPIDSYGGELTLRNVVFKDCESGGPLVVAALAENRTNHGILRMDNVHFVNCSGTGEGSCVYISGAAWHDSAYINNCTFTNCSAKYGAAVYFTDLFGYQSTARFTNCTFTNCYASVDGGAIYAGSKAMKLRFKNCTAYRCHAGDCGGFLFANHHDIIVDGAMEQEYSNISERSNIIGCYALDSGGAFATWWSGDVVQNFNIISCTAGAEVHNFNTVKANGYNSWGGGVCMNGSYQQLRYCDLYDNYADWYGGAVYCGWNHSVIERCTFRGNRCNDKYGQDIYVDSNDSVDLLKLTICTSNTSDAIAGDTPRTKDVKYLKESDTSDSCFRANIEDGDYAIGAEMYERQTLDIDGGKKSVNVSGANVQLWANGEANVFTITWDPVKKGYIIKSKVTGLVLDVEAASMKNGANIQQYTENGTNAQRWLFEPAIDDGYKDGYYYIRWLGGKYMEHEHVPSDRSPVLSGTNVRSWSFTGAENQVFKITKVRDNKFDAYEWFPWFFGEGSKERPFVISNAEQWKQFACNVAAGETYEGKYIELADDISIAYVPVGNYNQGKAFKGHFDGKNHTVHYMDASDNWDRGLFSCCDGATIKNLRVTGKIAGTISLAGICAGATNTTFENCTSDVYIESSGGTHVAGIAAKTNGINCTNNGEIHGGTYLSGGIAALAGGNSEFIGCRNNGYVYTSNENAGGMVGEATAHVTVKRCVNNARIESGNVTVGGMIGCIRKGADIISCINTENGVISSRRHAAGMIGWTSASNEKINISNCANYGEIKVTVGDCGGIAVNYKNDNMTVANCFNATAKISYFKPSTVDIADGDYVIYTALDERYAVDIENGNNAKNIPGKNAHLWQNGDANVFTITKDNVNGTYIIKSKVTGLVLDVSCASRDDGANIQQWSSNGTDAQRWVFEDAGSGYYYIRCVGGQYMDASGMVGGAIPHNGVNIQSWSFTGAPNQQFSLARVNDIAEGDYIIYTALNEKLALDIAGGKGAVNVVGANVHLWENGGANVFTITKDPAKDAYSIQSKVTGLMLDVANGSKANTVNIQQWASNGTDAQRWVFEPAGNGYYYIRCLGGQYMDAENMINGNQPSNGVNISSYQFTGDTNQKFRLVRADGIEDGDYVIYTALNKKMALDIEGGKNSVNVWGRNVHLWENGEANVFTITKDPARNAYSIQSPITGLMLDVVNGSKENGANIQQWEDNGLDPQRWVFEPAGNGYYYIRCLGGQYMDVAGFNSTNGANIHSWAFTGADNQKFMLVKASSTTGAISPENSKGTYKNCYYLSGGTGDKRGTALSSAECKDTLVSKMNTYIMENTTSANREDWLYWTLDEGRGYAMPDIVNVSQFVMEGSGTADDPYLIATADHLNDLANDLRHGIDYKGKYFKLTNSLSYSGEPLGSNGAKFAGTFDGDYHTMNVRIESGSNTAFFSELNGATVKNLTVAGSVKGMNGVAGIAGYAYGGAVIDNCHVTATVTGTAENVGGVVGMMDNSTVSNCRVDGTVTGYITSTGGIVGGILSGCTIVNCVSAGTVIGEKAVGGILGCVLRGDVKIINCAVLGSTDVPKDADGNPLPGTAFGGIVGFVGAEVNSASILYCFSKCQIGGSENRGFIVGNNEGGKSIICTVKNATTGTDVITLFNMASDGGVKVSKVVGNDDTAATTAKATKISSMNLSKTATTLNDLVAGKTEGNIALTGWTYDSANACLYPKSFVCASAELQGSGTVIDPYRISIPEHLIRLSNDVYAGETYAGKYFRVTRDFIYEGPRVGAPDRPFSGIFDGDYHKLKITVTSDEGTVGLFSELKGATVKNLELEGKVEGANAVGAIAGYAYGGTVIDNCLISATVKGAAENCGGVVGLMDNSTVSNCRVDGAVTGYSTSTGGIVGGILSGGTIVNCVSSGKITGEKAVGGILGCVQKGDPVILNCASLGSTVVPKNANGKTYVGYEHGGIVGFVGEDVDSVSILACFSAIKLGGSSDCGYIVGNMVAPTEKIKAEELYYAALTAGLSACGTGTALTAKVTATTNEKLREAATALTKYAKAHSVPGVSAASWKVDTKTIYPKTYVGILSFNASVFSEHSLPAVIIIGVGILAGIVTTVVLYRKKKKKAALAVG